MSKLINQRNHSIILDNLRNADTFWSRFRGLMGVPTIPMNTGLMIKPCNSVHCFFMKFPIDVLFLDKHNQVVYIEKNMRPGKISPIIRKADYVIEGNAGHLSRVVELGDYLSISE